jgi:hypothetical protein
MAAIRNIVLRWGIVAAISLFVYLATQSTKEADPYSQIRPDPGVVRSNSDGKKGYGAIDLWAVQGIDIKLAIGILIAQGYSCSKPSASDIESPPLAPAAVQCRKVIDGLLARTAVITLETASSHAQHIWVVSAVAKLTDRGVITRLGGPLWRTLGWIEPVEMVVKGLPITKPIELASLLNDRANPGGWFRQCNDDVLSGSCPFMTRDRREQGIPQLTEGAALNALGTCTYIGAMFDVGLRHDMRGNKKDLDGKTLDHYERMPMRFVGNSAEVDFTGQDLSGNSQTATMVLNAESGEVQKIRFYVKDLSREYPVQPVGGLHCHGMGETWRSMLVLQQAWGSTSGGAVVGNTLFQPWWFVGRASATLNQWSESYAKRVVRLESPHRERFWSMADTLKFEKIGATSLAPPSLQKLVSIAQAVQPIWDAGGSNGFVSIELLQNLKQQSVPISTELLLTLALKRCGIRAFEQSNHEFVENCWRATSMTWPESAEMLRTWLKPMGELILDSKDDSRLINALALLQKLSVQQ